MVNQSSEAPCAGFCAGFEKKAAYERVLDGRKQPIRGLWRRGEKFYARLTVQDKSGNKLEKRIPLTARNGSDARDEMLRLQLGRSAQPSEPLRCAAKLKDYVATYIADAAASKRPRTIALEQLHFQHWVAALGEVQLDRINKGMIQRFRAKKREAGWTGRTANLAVTILRNLLNHARDNGLIQNLPTDGLRAIKWVPRRRSLVTRDDLKRLCDTAVSKCPKNGRALADYLKLMAWCGSRRNETLGIRWKDVSWERRQITIGADGQTKNHEARSVDFNEALEAHLKEMFSRRKTDSEFQFPAFRGAGPAKSFRESLSTASGGGAGGSFATACPLARPYLIFPRSLSSFQDVRETAHWRFVPSRRTTTSTLAIVKPRIFSTI